MSTSWSDGHSTTGNNLPFIGTAEAVVSGPCSHEISSSRDLPNAVVLSNITVNGVYSILAEWHKITNYQCWHFQTIRHNTKAFGQIRHWRKRTLWSRLWLCYRHTEGYNKDCGVRKELCKKPEEPLEQRRYKWRSTWVRRSNGWSPWPLFCQLSELLRKGGSLFGCRANPMDNYFLDKRSRISWAYTKGLYELVNRFYEQQQKRVKRGKNAIITKKKITS